MKKKWIRYIIRGVAACLAVWILLLAIAFAYIKIKKESIIASIKSELNKKISGKISFDDLSIDLIHNFPGVSIDIKNVHVHDSAFNIQQKELLRVGHVYTGFGLIDLLSGKKSPKYLKLTDGTIFLYADSLGNKNWDILKPSPKTQNKIALKRITLKNMNVFFVDDKKYKLFNINFEKCICKITDNGEQLKLEFDNNAFIKAACFNTKKGSYLTNKKWNGVLKLSFDKTSKKLSLKDQLVKLDKQTYHATGDFFLTDDPHFNLTIKTTDLTVKEAASIFPPGSARKMGQFTLSKPLQKVEAVLSGPMKYLSLPLVKVNFSVNDATIHIPGTDFDHCSFNALFNNEIDSSKIRDDKNSFLQFTNVKGQWSENEFDSKNITISDLINPFLRCNIHTKFSLSQLEKAIASRMLDFNSGRGEATLNYSGSLDSKSDMLYDLGGVITITDGDITYNPRNLHFKNTDIEIQFQNGDMLVKKMNTVLNDNQIRINGTVGGFLTFFYTDPSKAIFNWNVYSPNLDISKLKSSLRRSTAVKNKQRSNSFFENLNNKIDRLFDACNAYIGIQADKLVYKNFIATHVNGHLALTNDMIRLDNFSLQHAGGSISLNASTRDNGQTSSLQLQSKMENVDIKELFTSFNNFGLSTLTSKNISGSFSADINLSSTLDANDDLLQTANRGFVDFSLKNGRLQNLKPLMEIDNNFLQKRNLNDIAFAELKDRLDLNGNEIHVNRMEIRSSAISMFVEGVYSFTNNTDLSIQVPLKGLKKKDQDYVPENKGVEAKTGMSIFLRAKDDKDGKLKIAYEPFGRFRKKEK